MPVAVNNTTKKWNPLLIQAVVKCLILSRLIWEQMKGEEIYNESIDQNGVRYGGSDVVENENNKIWRLPVSNHTEANTHHYEPNQLKLNICAPSFSTSSYVNDASFIAFTLMYSILYFNYIYISIKKNDELNKKA